MARRHSVNELAAELRKYLPAWPQADIAAMTCVASVFGDVVIENRDVAVVIRNGRFYSAYKRKNPTRYAKKTSHMVAQK